jgi:hypothetical protein
MPEANADMVHRVVRGMGPDKATVDPASGARAVANIAAVHVPSFCSDPQNHQNYLNTYDLQARAAGANKGAHIGKGPAPPIPVRQVVDDVLSAVTTIPRQKIYFAAMEVNGTGIRFYGDVCLVLKRDLIPDGTFVLESNSYDLLRPPNTPFGTPPDPTALEPIAEDMKGLWGPDAPEMAVAKVFATREVGQRRLTTGQVSDAVLDDEDYLEVLKVGSFDASDLQEARVSAADAAAEEQIGTQLRLGPCPSLSELQWRKHRRAATKALLARGVRTRIITTSGRVRT